MSYITQSPRTPDVSFSDMVTDLRALYGNTYSITMVDDLLADFRALYAGARLPLDIDDFGADMQALYGHLPVRDEELITDFQALYTA